MGLDPLRMATGRFGMRAFADSCRTWTVLSCPWHLKIGSVHSRSQSALAVAGAAEENRLPAAVQPAASVAENGRIMTHVQYYWFLLAEGQLTRRLFASMLGRIDDLPLPSEQPRLPSPMKMITISPRNGEVSGRAGSGSPGDEFLELRGVVVEAGVATCRGNVLACTQVGV